jgi:hypothetical protein
MAARGARGARTAALALAILLGAGQSAFALPHAQQTGASPSPAPSGSPATLRPAAAATPSAVLPQGSELIFLLEHDVNSGLVQTGTTVAMRLKAPIVLNGLTIADAGTQTIVRVLSAHRATSGMVDGNMQIAIDPLPLKGGLSLPIRLTHEMISVQHSAGEQSTQDLQDMAGMLVFPGYIFYRALRKGKDVILEAGTPVRAFTAAALDARDPSVVVVTTPMPLIVNSDPVHAEFSPAAFVAAPTPHPRPTRTPKPSPSPPMTPGALPPSTAPSAAQSPAQ